MRKSQLLITIALLAMLVWINQTTEDISFLKSVAGGLPWYGWAGISFFLIIVGVGFAIRDGWRARRLLAAAILVCSAYLSLADYLAIRRGIWQIREEGILGLRFGGHLPLEEALFFFLTVVMSAQGFVMLATHFHDKERNDGKSSNRR